MGELRAGSSAMPVGLVSKCPTLLVPAHAQLSRGVLLKEAYAYLNVFSVAEEALLPCCVSLHPVKR